MLKVTQHSKGNRNYIWIPIIISVFLHFGFYITSTELMARAPKDRKPIKVTIQQKEKPKVVKPEIKPPPPPPKPQPKPKPKKVAEPKPKPNKKTPKPEVKPEEPPKPVFGVTKDSVAAKSGVSVRVGNTLEKEMEKKATKVADIQPLPPAEDVQKPYATYELSKMPSFKTQVKPIYTDEARNNEIEGQVILSVWLSDTGKVLKIRIIKKLGYGLEKAAIEAIRQSKFNPGYKDGIPVPVKNLRIPFTFILED